MMLEKDPPACSLSIIFHEENILKKFIAGWHDRQTASFLKR